MKLNKIKFDNRTKNTPDFYLFVINNKTCFFGFDDFVDFNYEYQTN